MAKNFTLSKLTVTALCFWAGCFYSFLCHAQTGVAVNETGASPNATSILDVSSSTKGVLLVRMNTAQRDAISNPALGLIIFNTDCNAFNYYNGTHWAPLNAVNGSLSSPGTITGNTNPCQSAAGFSYSVASVPGATHYTWIVPSGSSITNGQGSAAITVTTGTTAGNICVAANNACETSASSCLPITLNNAPASAPTASTSGIQQEQFTINWGSVSGATVYYVDVATNAGFGAGTFVSGYNNYNAGNNTSAIITGLSCNSTYYYRVRAGNVCGNGAYSTTGSATTSACCVSAPAQPSISGNTFTCASSPAETYSISAIAGATSYNWTVSAGSINSGQNTTSISASLTGSGTISVTASNACGTSPAGTLAVTACNLASWQYSKPVTITNSSGSALSDYQVKLNVSYVAGKMKSDFSDLRFANSSCTSLNYWIETYTASTSAVVWVKVPSVPTTGTTIYMFYGNNSASSASNGANTFILFDDFENGTTINSSLWSTVGSVSQSGGKLNVNGTGTGGADRIISNASFGPGTAFYSKGKLALENASDVDYGFKDNGPNFHRSWTYQGQVQTRSGGTYPSGVGYDNSQVSTWEINWFPSGTANFYLNGSLIGNNIGTATGSTQISLQQWCGCNGPTTSEILYVRKFVSPEPGTSIGAEVSCP